MLTTLYGLTMCCLDNMNQPYDMLFLCPHEEPLTMHTSFIYL